MLNLDVVRSRGSIGVECVCMCVCIAVCIAVGAEQVNLVLRGTLGGAGSGHCGRTPACDESRRGREREEGGEAGESRGEMEHAR